MEAYALDQEWNLRPFGLQADVLTTEASSPGQGYVFTDFLEREMGGEKYIEHRRER